MTFTSGHDIENAKEYKERLKIALKASKTCIFEVDLRRQLYTFFENAEDIFGVTGDVILKEVQPFSELSSDEYQKAVMDYFTHPDDKKLIEKAFKNIYSGKPTTYTARMKAGASDYVWCKIDVTPVIDDNVPIKMIGVISDISDLKYQEEVLEKKANLDAFTGLYNKEYSMLSIRMIFESGGRGSHALLLLDINKFKLFNDMHGHLEGDKMIKATADMLTDSFRKTDLVGRFGGDEFIVLVNNIPSIEWLSDKVSKIVTTRCGEHGSRNSIGIALFPDDGRSYSQLFEKADKALYYSKNNNRDFTFYSSI